MSDTHTNDAPEQSAKSGGMHYRWRLQNGARTLWQPARAGYLPVPVGAEGLEFHQGAPELPVRSRAQALPGV